MYTLAEALDQVAENVKQQNEFFHRTKLKPEFKPGDHAIIRSDLDRDADFNFFDHPAYGLAGKRVEIVGEAKQVSVNRGPHDRPYTMPYYMYKIRLLNPSEGQQVEYDNVPQFFLQRATMDVQAEQFIQQFIESTHGGYEDEGDLAHVRKKQNVFLGDVVEVIRCENNMPKDLVGAVGTVNTVGFEPNEGNRIYINVDFNDRPYGDKIPQDCVRVIANEPAND